MCVCLCACVCLCVCVCDTQDENDRDCYTHTVQPLPGVRAFARMVRTRVIKKTFYSGKAYSPHTHIHELMLTLEFVSVPPWCCVAVSPFAPAFHMFVPVLCVCAGEPDDYSRTTNTTNASTGLSARDDDITVNPRVPHRLSCVTY